MQENDQALRDLLRRFDELERRADDLQRRTGSILYALEVGLANLARRPALPKDVPPPPSLPHESMSEFSNV